MADRLVTDDIDLMVTDDIDLTVTHKVPEGMVTSVPDVAVDRFGQRGLIGGLVLQW